VRESYKPTASREIWEVYLRGTLTGRPVDSFERYSVNASEGSLTGVVGKGRKCVMLTNLPPSREIWEI
jgi:hypothetical protein